METDSKYPPELQVEITKRRNSGDLRYDFINDDLIAKEILKEREVVVPLTQQRSISLPQGADDGGADPKIQPRDPEKFLREVYRYFIESTTIVPTASWENWAWKFDKSGKWISLGQVTFTLPEKFLDGDFSDDETRSLEWSPNINGIDFLLILLKGKRIFSLSNKIIGTWYLKIADEDPIKPEVKPEIQPESEKREVICANSNKDGTGCVFQLGRMIISSDLKEVSGYRVGDRLKIRKGLSWGYIFVSDFPSEDDVVNIAGFTYYPLDMGGSPCVVIQFGDRYVHNKVADISAYFEKV